MKELIEEVRGCRFCADFLPVEPRPVIQISRNSKIVIVGQAPGRRVFESGIPWNDRSGDRLRQWLKVSTDQFYDPELFALLPMGFCYPGTGKNGDFPPRPECAPLWHKKLLSSLKSVNLIILCGQYAQKYYLKERYGGNITATIKAYQQFLPYYLPIPHPSPRNIAWFKTNPWFETEVLPILQLKIKCLLPTN